MCDKKEDFGRGLIVILVHTTVISSYVPRMYPGDGNWVIVPLVFCWLAALDEARSDWADTRFANQIHKDTNTKVSLYLEYPYTKTLCRNIQDI